MPSLKFSMKLRAELKKTNHVWETWEKEQINPAAVFILASEILLCCDSQTWNWEQWKKWDTNWMESQRARISQTPGSAGFDSAQTSLGLPSLYRKGTGAGNSKSLPIRKQIGIDECFVTSCSWGEQFSLALQYTDNIMRLLWRVLKSALISNI